MRKTDKKIDKQLREVLTDVCETAIKEYDGFQWLTHLVNYSSFPQSLKIVCIFDTNERLAKFTSNTKSNDLASLIQVKLREMGVNIKNVSNHISYDSEEACKNQNNGKWADRLA